MPVDRRAALQLGLLILIVPVQFFVSKFYSTPDTGRDLAIRKLFVNAARFRNKYLSWRSWQMWCVSLFDQMKFRTYTFHGADNPDGESPAIEVIEYKHPHGHYGMSMVPRDSHPTEVKYRVGQIIQHKLYGYRGVIVAWDPIAKAPEGWLQSMIPPSKKYLRQTPHYAILADTRDRKIPQITYIAQENIKIITQTRIVHPDVNKHFSSWDGAQYLMAPWLQALYPRD